MMRPTGEGARTRRSLRRVMLELAGTHCPDCIGPVVRAITEVPGVIRALGPHPGDRIVVDVIGARDIEVTLATLVETSGLRLRLVTSWGPRRGPRPAPASVLTVPRSPRPTQRAPRLLD